MCASRVQAGFPSPADDHLEGFLDLNQHLIQNKDATFFVRVQGNSMIDAGIKPNDILIVDKSLAPNNNSIVIAVLDGEFTVKRLLKTGSKIVLKAENPDFEDIEIIEGNELIIWGTVTSVIHQYV
jgi:DNA polymerase V